MPSKVITITLNQSAWHSVDIVQKYTLKQKDIRLQQFVFLKFVMTHGSHTFSINALTFSERESAKIHRLLFLFLVFMC